MKNVLKTFAVIAVCLAALTGTAYASSAKAKSHNKSHAKHASAKPISEKSSMKSGK